MKKAYSRPLLAFESFQLDAALAAGCTIIMKWGEKSCSVDPNGDTYLGEGGLLFTFPNCEVDCSGTCYQGPLGLFNPYEVVFNSGG